MNVTKRVTFSLLHMEFSFELRNLKIERKMIIRAAWSQVSVDLVLKKDLTIIMKLKEATGAEVTVELDEDLIGSGGHTLLSRAATKLADLRRGLVRSIPDTQEHRQGEGGVQERKRQTEKEKMIYE